MNVTRREFAAMLGASATMGGGAGTDGGVRGFEAISEFFAKGSGVRMFCLGNHGKGPMFGAVFVGSDGKVVVFDGGHIDDAVALGKLLHHLGGRVEKWFITHNHDDHFGALWGLMRDHVELLPKVGAVHYSFPPESWFKLHEPSCCGVSSCFRGMLQRHKLWPHPLHMGDMFNIGEIKVEVLNDYDMSITDNACNNSSICFSVRLGGRSILVTGDIGEQAGDRLLGEIPGRLPHDVVFMSHHGQCGAKKSFYAAVKPKVAIWPTPKWLWDNDVGEGPGSGPWKTNFVKCWMQELGVKRNYVVKHDLLFS